LAMNPIIQFCQASFSFSPVTPRKSKVGCFTHEDVRRYLLFLGHRLGHHLDAKFRTLEISGVDESTESDGRQQRNAYCCGSERFHRGPLVYASRTKPEQEGSSQTPCACSRAAPLKLPSCRTPRFRPFAHLVSTLN
jgi:hypothetical protein